MEDVVKTPDAAFWHNKRVLVTGHTGFKGSWLCHWLLRMGAKVSGLSLAPKKDPNLFTLLELGRRMENHMVDLRNLPAVSDTLNRIQPDLVLHLAAQALVRQSYRDPIHTYSSNVMGSVHLLEAVRMTESVKAVLVITTDKVYQNRDSTYPYREIDQLGGYDPYSASKAAVEIITESYRNSFLRTKGICIATARAGNVFGGGDWSHERVVPDIISTWLENRCLTLRNPHAIRPWQHVLEPLNAYLVITEKLAGGSLMCPALNIGPDKRAHISVQTLVEMFRKANNGGAWQVRDDPSGLKEAETLMLDNSMLKRAVGIHPRWSIEKSVDKTVAWYRDWVKGEPASLLCDKDITEFENEIA